MHGSCCREDRNKPMLEKDLSLAAMAEALAKSTDYRVLRRLVPRETFNSSVGLITKSGILLDVETTGLDQRKDEVIDTGWSSSTTCLTVASPALGTSFPRSTNPPNQS